MLSLQPQIDSPPPEPGEQHLPAIMPPDQPPSGGFLLPEEM